MSKTLNWRDGVEMLYDPPTLQARVHAMGQEISQLYTDSPLCIVGVLKGSFMFYADLVRAMDVPLTCEFIGISSYGDDIESSGVVQITSDLGHNIAGLDVVLVEDIIDSGLSMRYLIDNFSTRRPRSLRVCTLLEKPANARVKVPIDYVGFRVPNDFVVGYGLDVAGLYRNLPYIGIYRGKA